MSTSSPISRYHEVYVHQSRIHPDSLENEIQRLNSDVTEIESHSGTPSRSAAADHRPPSYIESLIEMDERVTNRLTEDIDGPSTRISNPRVGRDLPSYDEAMIDPENAPPPTYDSLFFGRVREARKSSKGLMDFAKNVLILLLGTLGCTIILCVTIVIPICMITFGTIYLYDCPQGEYIPVYLLVGGGFGVLKQLLNLSTRVRNREDQEAERLRQSPTQQLINCFMFGWFIIGSFWIFKEYEPNYDPSLGKYCNKSLYMFAFWLITSVYISLGILIVGLCAIAIGSVLTHSRNSNHTSL